MKVIEKETVERDYEFIGIDAIIEHQKLGRLFICDGFGGQDDPIYGGMVRWRHGAVVKIEKNDTLETLKALNPMNYIDLRHLAINGREILDWSGYDMEAIAKKAGLE